MRVEGLRLRVEGLGLHRVAKKLVEGPLAIPEHRHAIDLLGGGGRRARVLSQLLCALDLGSGLGVKG